VAISSELLSLRGTPKQSKTMCLETLRFSRNDGIVCLCEESTPDAAISYDFP